MVQKKRNALFALLLAAPSLWAAEGDGALALPAGHGPNQCMPVADLQGLLQNAGDVADKKWRDRHGKNHCLHLTKHGQALEALRVQHQQELTRVTEQHEDGMAQLQREHLENHGGDKCVATATHQQELERVQQQHDRALTDLTQQHDRVLQQLGAQHQQEVEQAQKAALNGVIMLPAFDQVRAGVLRDDLTLEQLNEYVQELVEFLYRGGRGNASLDALKAVCAQQNLAAVPGVEAPEAHASAGNWLDYHNRLVVGAIVNARHQGAAAARRGWGRTFFDYAFVPGAAVGLTYAIMSGKLPLPTIFQSAPVLPSWF